MYLFSRLITQKKCSVTLIRYVIVFFLHSEEKKKFGLENQYNYYYGKINVLYESACSSNSIGFILHRDVLIPNKRTVGHALHTKCKGFLIKKCIQYNW